MKSFLLSSLIVASLAPAIASAADGTINFNGSVVSTTCTYTGTSGNSQSVTLPPVSASALNAAGTVAAVTPFDIRLTNCGATSKKVAVNMEGGSSDGTTGRLNNTATGTGAATNVSLQLANRTTRTDIRVPSATVAVDSATDGSAVIPLTVAYYANAAATAGNVASTVNFSIIYP